MRSPLLGLLGFLVVSVSVAACGGGGDSTFDPGADPTAGGGGGNGGSPQFNGGTSGDDAGSGTSTASCASSTAAAQPVPVNLVFMFDQSGSMGGSSASVKWNPVTSAMKSFFSDPASAGTSASLQYFPLDADECSQSTYQTPEVALTTLPNATQFASSLSSHSPNGGTPTLPAISGAIAYAQTVAAQHPGEATAIVLVTDGEPNDCSSSVSNVSAAAGTVAQKIPTYVIGVGSATQNLDTIAAAGGTQKAIIVSATNGAQANADFQAALQKIRGSVLACDYAIPPAPAGQQLDIHKVNVVFTPAGGQAQTLTYDKDCTTGTGWHYDDATKPTKIVLCQTTCDGAKSASGGSVSIAFGCDTQGGVR